MLFKLRAGSWLEVWRLKQQLKDCRLDRTNDGRVTIHMFRVLRTTGGASGRRGPWWLMNCVFTSFVLVTNPVTECEASRLDTTGIEE